MKDDRLEPFSLVILPNSDFVQTKKVFKVSEMLECNDNAYVMTETEESLVWANFTDSDSIICGKRVLR